MVSFRVPRRNTELREEKQKSNFLFNLFCLPHYLCDYKSSAKETMHEHDEELEIYDNAFKNYSSIKAFDVYVFISLKLIACRICVFLSGLF